MSDLSPPPKSSTKPQLPRFECELRSSRRAATWIRTCGEWDLRAAPQFEQALHAALAGARLVIVDLRQLTFIDSTGQHLIIEAAARARRSGRRLVFVRGPVQIDLLFELIGLAYRLEITDLKPVLVSTARPTASAPWKLLDDRPTARPARRPNPGPLGRRGLRVETSTVSDSENGRGSAR